MKRILLTLSVISSVFLFSCQKEVDFANSGNNGNSGNPGSSSGKMLYKTESKNGSETATTFYTYNAAKKIVNEKITGTSQGIDVGNEYRYYRNASGIITSYTQISAELAQSGVDSVTTTVHYSTSLSRYTSTVSSWNFSGIDVLDSTVFVYGSNGKVTSSEIYQAIPLLGGAGYDLLEKIKYTYSGNGNMSQQDFYVPDPSTGSEDLVATVKYTFDNKTSALNLGSEAFVLGHPDLVSVNNATKVEIINITDPANNVTLASTYTYNSNSMPATGVSTRNPGNVVDNITYFYQ